LLGRRRGAGVPKGFTGGARIVKEVVGAELTERNRCRCRLEREVPDKRGPCRALWRNRGPLCSKKYGGGDPTLWEGEHTISCKGTRTRKKPFTGKRKYVCRKIVARGRTGLLRFLRGALEGRSKKNRAEKGGHPSLDGVFKAQGKIGKIGGLGGAMCQKSIFGGGRKTVDGNESGPDSG